MSSNERQCYSNSDNSENEQEADFWCSSRRQGPDSRPELTPDAAAVDSAPPHIPSQSLPDSVADSGCKLVYLCRDPKDCFVSLWHFWNRFMPWDIDEALQQFCDGRSLFGPYWEHVLGYWRWHVQRPSQVLFLTYEELAADTLIQLRRLAGFLGRPFTEAEQEAGVDMKIVEACAMKNLSRLEVNRSGSTDMH
ncbi:hypothetical protein GUJ93_ZPchr0009g2209 [Zizania palustris]|uniref:Sulfotransferase n=1 Tax=Zizania palustris TaxID=103762 RepID=A0A8J5UZ08_ZIZPA|nr:hypothetical protein GUJ93_ZPchr0009g2209 [Zizania palustris]